jgi:hypothetical protein
MPPGGKSMDAICASDWCRRVSTAQRAPLAAILPSIE